MLKRYTPVLSQMGFSAIQVAGRLAHVGLIENDWQAELPGQKKRSHILISCGSGNTEMSFPHMNWPLKSPDLNSR